MKYNLVAMTLVLMISNIALIVVAHDQRVQIEKSHYLFGYTGGHRYVGGPWTMEDCKDIVARKKDEFAQSQMTGECF